MMGEGKVKMVVEGKKVGWEVWVGQGSEVVG